MQMNSTSMLAAAVVFGASVGLAPVWAQDTATPPGGGTTQGQDGMSPGADGTSPGINGGADGAISGGTGADEAAPAVDGATGTGTDGAAPGTGGTTPGATGTDGAAPGTGGATPGAAGADGSPSGMDATSGTDGAIDSLDPFAGSDIDITEAGTSVEDAESFFNALDSDQQEEVMRRCAGAMGSTPEQAAVNEATTLCANLGEAGLLEDGTPTPQ